MIQKIRERGHQVCLDDFGAGSAGLHDLRQFPVDVVKIDGSYVRRSERSERDGKLLQGMIDICTQLGAKTVAETIESEKQAARMKSMGVTYRQGFYFGKPVALNRLKAPDSGATRAA